VTIFRTHMSRHERDELFGGNAEGRLDLGCVAAHGHFNFDAKTRSYPLHAGGQARDGISA
jgi:hypothetical protein